MSLAPLLAGIQQIEQVQPRVLVIGDLILDRYTWGDAERISQEAPVLVLRSDRESSYLGGAANVCHMLRGLGASVDCVGVVGRDESGLEVHRLLSAAGVQDSGVRADDRRPTTVKQRFVGRAASRHPNQILRVDREVREPLHEALEAELVDIITQQIPLQDVVLISDYGKGVCTPHLLAQTIAAAAAANVPVLIDPSPSASLLQYRGASVIKPNRAEASAACQTPIRSVEEAIQAGRQLCEMLELEAAVITLDKDGICHVNREGQGQVHPTVTRSVYDITGAGDMVLAVLGASEAARLDPSIAIPLANVAAGLEVERMGVAIVTTEEIRHEVVCRTQPGGHKRIAADRIAARMQSHRDAGQRIVMTNGCFDLLHVGHVSYLNQAASWGDILVVAINSDDSVRRLKGPQRPVIQEADRASMLSALACVDYVVVFEEDTPHAILDEVRPDLLAKGGTYSVDEVVGREVVEAYGGEVRLAGLVEGISTTKIVESMNSATAKQWKEAG